MEQTSQPSAALVGDEPIFCPGCGFDLRGTSSGRCGECGLEVDREALRVSGIPWAHRAKMGRVRTYLKTVWQVTIGSKRLRYESAKPQELADGRSFGRVTAALLATVLLATFFMAIWKNEGWSFLGVQPENPFRRLSGRSPQAALWYWQDTVVPWSTGATLRPVLPVCLLLFAMYLSGAQRLLFRASSFTANQTPRGGGLGWYCAAALTFLLPAAACAIGAIFLTDSNFSDDFPIPHIITALWWMAGVLGVIAIPGTFFRTTQWLIRSRRDDPFLWLLAPIELLGLWVLGAIVCLGVLPWCIGFVWLAIDSLRG
jgi:hypothetical protein